MIGGMATALLAIVTLAASLAVQIQPDRRVILDNPTATVTRLRFAPGAKEEVHTHPFPLLIVQVSSGTVNVTDREVVRLGNRPGEIWFIAPETRHAVVNRSGAAIEMLAVAIKPDRQPAPAAPTTEAPPGIARATLIDNDVVRVVRVRFAPEGREPVHSHPNDLITVQVTAGRVEILTGSSRRTQDCEPGFVQFLPRNVAHAYANADPNPFDLLSVSIK
jgi:quercetin dioxygenase-like cupin family protein